ncbi:nicotinate-nucleotide--dimethylbenzimidazole phosphoribosyltransferase [Corynebacterium lowii]|uniref:Nicotinate-nucleotide--dimethylbenzimidazole phosphoribosyltransferase n=1 Tax=Corynebacterium lowii TaxID=1544413 RepID=A0A0Q0UFH1_9CORY|nr:nicotinate-nucleotide--dimethylbenzimidazole phosphoribosyltransferase [Corynebacterium lowii]KQB86793.1 Nicotinate-nucleotide--dimethylbenzimidazole phosphoribosyltransferase [Corynebacterium lowii]MDP9851479.1 nicotinate-nucleotide--dimethylbenzimidazole phosphoribosyltransferase [Corynebacterium lowii]
MELFSPVTSPTGSAEHLPRVLPQDIAGRLRDVASFFAAAQGVSATEPLRPIRNSRMMVFYGNRSATRASVLSTEQAISFHRKANEGTGPTHAFTEAVGIPATVIDVPPESSFDQAKEMGIQAADHQADRGTDLLLAASIGAGEDEEALALLGLLTGREPVAVLGFHGTADKQWSKRVTLIRDLMFQARAHKRSAVDLLRHHASPALVALVSFLAQCAVRRTPILLDTTVSCVAACYAEALAPGAKNWMLAGQLTPHAGHLMALRHLGLTPLFALNMPLGMGTGAATTVPLVRAATSLYGEVTGEAPADEPTSAPSNQPTGEPANKTTGQPAGDR